jgi:hypothetical protein
LAGTLSVVAWGLALGLAPATGPTIQSKPVQVEIDAPGACANANDFLNSLQSRSHLLRQAAGDEPRTTLQVRMIEMRRYVLGELRILDENWGIHTRKMQGANCDEVLQALSLAAAVALDPSVLLSEPDPTAAGANPTPADPPSTVSPPVLKSADVQRTTDEAPSVASQGGRRFEIGAASVGSILLSSGISPGLSVFGRWIPAGGGRFRPTVGMAVTYVRNDVLRSPGAAQASLIGIVMTMCGTGWGASVLKVKPCGLLMAGLLSVSGLQVARTSPVDVLWLSAGVAVRAAVHLRFDFSLELEAGVSAALLRREFYTTLPSHVVEKTTAISSLASLGLAYSF